MRIQRGQMSVRMPKRSEGVVAAASGDDGPKYFGDGEGRRHGVEERRAFGRNDHDVLRNLRQHVLALQVISPSDFEPAAFDSEVVLVDAEDAGESRHRVTPALVRAYRQAFDAHCAAISAPAEPARSAAK